MDAPTERVPQSKREPISLRFSSRWARATDSSGILQQESSSHRHAGMCSNVAKSQRAARQRVNARTRPTAGPPSRLLVAAATTLRDTTRKEHARSLSLADSLAGIPLFISPATQPPARQSCQSICSRTPQRTSASQSGHRDTRGGRPSPLPPSATGRREHCRGTRNEKEAQVQCNPLSAAAHHIAVSLSCPSGQLLPTAKWLTIAPRGSPAKHLRELAASLLARRAQKALKLNHKTEIMSMQATH